MKKSIYIYCIKEQYYHTNNKSLFDKQYKHLQTNTLEYLDKLEVERIFIALLNLILNTGINPGILFRYSMCINTICTSFTVL